MIYLYIFLTWLAISICYMVYSLGNKTEQPPWYDLILGWPALLIVIICCAPRDIKHWCYHNWPTAKPRVGRGRVEKIDFTWGAGGNQYTTIGGISYATFWNALDIDWKVGEIVNFEFYWDRLHLGANNYKVVVHARNIRSAFLEEQVARANAPHPDLLIDDD